MRPWPSSFGAPDVPSRSLLGEVSLDHVERLLITHRRQHKRLSAQDGGNPKEPEDKRVARVLSEAVRLIEGARAQGFRTPHKA